MKKLFLFTLLCLATYIQLTAQIAEVYVCRPKAYSTIALNIQVFIDGKKIGQLAFGERLVYRTSDFGDHVIKVQIGKATNEVTLNLEAWRVLLHRDKHGNNKT